MFLRPIASQWPADFPDFQGCISSPKDLQLGGGFSGHKSQFPGSGKSMFVLMCNHSHCTTESSVDPKRQLRGKMESKDWTFYYATQRNMGTAGEDKV